MRSMSAVRRWTWPMRTPGSIGVSGDAIGVTGPCSRVGDMPQGSRTAPRRGATLAALVGAGRVGRVVGRVVIAMAAVAAALALAPAAGAQTTWLCGAEAAPDPCREPLQTTVQRADGSSTVETPALARHPAVDCFYVYPTVSEQPSVNA